MARYIQNNPKSIHRPTPVPSLRAYLTYLITIFFSLYLVSCGTSRRYYASEGVRTGSGEAIESGIASWYGPNFHGKMTANGEIYNMNAMTAAHRTLPFNSFVRVQNLDNGESVVVRINDRGPFAKNRIIDLSRRAASKIEMIGPGTARVRLYLVNGDLANARTSNLKVATYTVQLGSYKTERGALERSRSIRNSRVEKAYLNNGDSVYRVYYGVFTDRTKAEREREMLQQKGYYGYVKQIENR